MAGEIEIDSEDLDAAVQPLSARIDAIEEALGIIGVLAGELFEGDASKKDRIASLMGLIGVMPEVKERRGGGP